MIWTSEDEQWPQHVDHCKPATKHGRRHSRQSQLCSDVVQDASSLAPTTDPSIPHSYFLLRFSPTRPSAKALRWSLFIDIALHAMYLPGVLGPFLTVDSIVFCRGDGFCSKV